MSSQLCQRFLGWIWPALQAPAGRSPVLLREDIQTQIDAFGSSRWGSPSQWSFSGGAGVASYDYTDVPPDGYLQIWTHGTLWTDEPSSIRIHTIAVNMPAGVCDIQKEFAGTTAAAGNPQPALTIRRPFVVPPQANLQIRVASLGGSYHMYAHMFYHRVPIGEYLKLADG